MTTFGTLLRQYRVSRDLAQNALARRSGVNVGTVNRLERDQRLPPGPGMVQQLGIALHLSPGEIDRLLAAAGMSTEARRAATRRRWKRWGMADR